MSTDILSKLNTSGSGLDIISLASDLATAQIAPKKSLVEQRIDRAEVSLGAIDRLRESIGTLGSALTATSSAQISQVTSDSGAVGAFLTDASKLTPQLASVGVTQLATQQVLEFSGFSGPDDIIGPGTLTIDFGQWDAGTFTAGSNPGGSLTFGPTATLQDMADTLNEIDGVMARVVDVGDGTFSLGVLSDTGADNALRFSVAAGSSAALTGFDFSADPSAVELRAASDAILTLDNITLRRQTNWIDDVIPGVTLSLDRPTDGIPATIAVGPDPDLASEAFMSLADNLNQFRSLSSEMLARGAAGEDAGPLAGDAGLSALMSEVGSILSSGTPGLDDDPVFLSEFGFRTERDGSYSFDEDLLMAKLQDDPSSVEAMLRGRLSSETEGVEMSGTPRASATPGAYGFAFDSATGTARIGDDAFAASNNGDGTWSIAVTSGPLAGVALQVENDVTASTLHYGVSPFERLQSAIDTALTSDGAIGRREASYSRTLSEGIETLEALDQDIIDIENRYRSRFTEMERIVTQLNSTGDYLTGLLDAWNGQNN